MLQVLGCKEVLGAGEARWIKNPGGESEILCGPVKIAKQHPKSGFVSCKFVRFRLLLNDGDYSNSFVLLSSKVHICIYEVPKSQLMGIYGNLLIRKQISDLVLNYGLMALVVVDATHSHPNLMIKLQLGDQNLFLRLKCFSNSLSVWLWMKQTCS